MATEIKRRKMMEVVKKSIGKRVDVTLNFLGNYPPERRSFQGTLLEIGEDYLILEVQRTGNQLVVQLKDLGYIVIITHPLESGDAFFNNPIDMPSV